MAGGGHLQALSVVPIVKRDEVAGEHLQESQLPEPVCACGQIVSVD
jgi:hypothetical protein